MEELVKCEFCGKEYNKYGIKSHIWRNHGEGVNHDPNRGYKDGNRVVWNKGLTKDTNDILLKNSKIIKEKYKNGKIIPSRSFLNRKHTSESILKMKQSNRKRKNSDTVGRGKFGWYKDYWCDSTWELAFVIYNLDHDIKFERNKEGFEYIYNGEVCKYYPDFILEDGTYLEIKGYMNGKDEEKIKQFKFPLKVLSTNEILPYINYVKETYKIDKLYHLYNDKHHLELEEKKKKDKEEKELIKLNKRLEKIEKLEKYRIIKRENAIGKRLEKIEERKNIIRNSNIDFSIFGWGLKLSKLLGISSQKTVKFVKEYMLDELNPFFNKL